MLLCCSKIENRFLHRSFLGERRTVGQVFVQVIHVRVCTFFFSRRPGQQSGTLLCQPGGYTTVTRQRIGQRRLREFKEGTSKSCLFGLPDFLATQIFCSFSPTATYSYVLYRLCSPPAPCPDFSRSFCSLFCSPPFPLPSSLPFSLTLIDDRSLPPP